MSYKKVVIYVEGPSDKECLDVVFGELIGQKSTAGVQIKIIGFGGKGKLLKRIPEKAANTVLNNPNVDIVVMPDLYPPHQGFEHETYSELANGLRKRFVQKIREKHGDDERFYERFHVFCFKYDLEVLLLAAPDHLARRLEVDDFPISWTTPVEDQNHDDPPKRVVERLFESCASSYVATVDAPEVLWEADYRESAGACPPCFKPFVEFLENL